MIKYKVDEAAQHYTLTDIDMHDYSAEDRLAILMYENGVAVKSLAIDGGEPEDNSFRRDGSWIAPALNDAYQLGLKHGGKND